MARIESKTDNKSNLHNDENRDNEPRSIYYKAVSDHLSCDLNGESVILSVKTGKYYGVNSVGSRIWTLVQEMMNFDQITSVLMEEFDIDDESCRKQVLLFLNKMKDEGLLKVSDG